MKVFNLTCTCLSYVILTLSSCSDNTHVIIDNWPDGTPKVVKNYYHEDTLLYQVISYFESGTTKDITHFERDIRSGWSISYYESGTVKDSIFLQDNIPIASSVHFHQNGYRESEGSYLDGRKNGLWNFYDSLGTLNEITDYTFGEKNGKSWFFNNSGWLIKVVDRYSEGNIKEIIAYQDSLRHGPYKLFDLEGNLKLTGEFQKGKKKGTRWTSYHSRGRKFKEIEYFSDNDWDTLLINLWNTNGEQTVKDGKGYFRFDNFADCNGKQIVKTQTTLFYEEGKETNMRVMARQNCDE